MNFTQLVATFGYWAVLVFVAIQCAGIPFPGGAILLAAAIYAGTTHQLAVTPIILAAATGAILGNLLGYLLGSRGGYRLLIRYGHFLRLDERKLKLGQYLYLKHGGAIVVLGRFLSVSRTSAAFLAGINRMGWVRFLLFTVVGGVIWATAIGLGAYYLGDSLRRPTGPLGIALTALVLCLVAFCIFLLLRNMHRLEDEAERIFPGPLDLDVTQKNIMQNEISEPPGRDVSNLRAIKVRRSPLVIVTELILLAPGIFGYLLSMLSGILLRSNFHGR